MFLNKIYFWLLRVCISWKQISHIKKVAAM